MKKRILIVNKSFELGGIQSSMVNMAKELSNHYDVDMFLYNPEGVMKERLDKRVNVLRPSWRLRCLAMPLGEVIKTRSPRMILFRAFATLWTKLFSNRLPVGIAIRHQSRLGEYDLAIA